MKTQWGKDARKKTLNEHITKEKIQMGMEWCSTQGHRNSNQNDISLYSYDVGKNWNGWQCCVLVWCIPVSHIVLVVVYYWKIYFETVCHFLLKLKTAILYDIAVSLELREIHADVYVYECLKKHCL